MKIFWLSRHKPLQSQMLELKRLFGQDVEVVIDPEPFSSAEEIVERFRTSEAAEIVVVAPLSVIGRLCELGVQPLWAEMQQVPVEEAEVVAASRGYQFLKFRRVKKLVLEFEEIKRRR